jgi:hypothetical protein
VVGDRRAEVAVIVEGDEGTDDLRVGGSLAHARMIPGPPTGIGAAGAGIDPGALGAQPVPRPGQRRSPARRLPGGT